MFNSEEESSNSFLSFGEHTMGANTNTYHIDFATAIQKLCSAVREENLAVFMGSGVSSFVNPDYPIWSGVTQRLKQDLPDCKTDDALDVSQEYERKHGKDKLAETVSSLFPDSTPNEEFYNELLKCRPKYLITTNWDYMLQNYIEAGLHMYDTVADDRELMNSKLLNKYIKMHGDFRHSFVLTRSSYDSYSKEYPLIENFVKSILCTTTVVFMGYSLSDVDFNQILEWIKVSAPSAPRFYCAFDSEHYNEDTASKFNTMGITTFEVQSFTDLFKRLNENEMEIQTKNPIHAFAQMVTPLCEDNAILLSSLQKFITNCAFDYIDEYRSVLRLLNIELTYDYKESRRSFFRKLIDFISQIDEKKQMEYADDFHIINDAVRKTGILGLSYTGFEKIFFPSECKEKCKAYINFDFDISDTDSDELKVKKIYENSSKNNKAIAKNALNLNSAVIKSDINEKRYRKLFISYFNQNKIIEILNRGIPISDAIEYIDIDKKYLVLPSVIQKDILDMYRFVTEEKLRDTLIVLKDAIRSIRDKLQNSWMAADKDRFRWSVEHKNLTDFVLLNNILIEDNYLFRQVQQAYVEIAVLRKSTLGRCIELNKNELFSCIRYFDHPVNHATLHKLFCDNNVELTSNKENENWLIHEVLPNCIKNYKQLPVFNSSPYLSNLLIIFAHSTISEENVHALLQGIKQIIEDCICNSYILCQIRNIVLFEHKKHAELLKEFKFLPLFISAINKYTEMHAGPEEQAEVIDGRCHCYETLYKIAIENDEIFDDIDYLKNIQKSFEKSVFDARTQFYVNVLMPFYSLGTDVVKNYLKDIFLNFMDAIPTSPVPSQFGGLLSLEQIKFYEQWYALKLIELELKKAKPEFITELEAWLTNILKETGMSSQYGLVINEICLLSKKNHLFDGANGLCKKLVEKYNSTRFLQI